MCKKLVIASCAFMFISIQATAEQPLISNDSDRTVMSNPYDTVEKLRLQKFNAVDENEMKIRQMFLQSGRKTRNTDAVFQGQINRLRENPGALDKKLALDLLNLDTVVQADRISADEAQRDWMVPSISMLEDGDESFGKPENIFLKDWELMRDENDQAVVGRVNDPMSRIQVRVGMILGEFGRIMAVRDTGDAYFIVLESGDRIQGSPSNG